MAKNFTNHHVTAVNESDSAGVSASHKFRSSSDEVFPLQTLPGQGPRPNSRRGDTTFTDSSTSSLSKNTNALLTRHETDNIPSPRPSDDRPRWLRKSSARSRRKLESLLSIPALSKVMDWMKGPSPPRPYKISPLLPNLQSWPTSTASKYLSPASGCIFVTSFICVVWLVTFSTILATSKKGEIADAGALAPVRLSCIARLWDTAPGCGLDGRECQPFKGSAFPFICPSDCASVQVLEPLTIGDQEINYRSLIIGGPAAKNQSVSIYRGDSFICPAAIHAGVISNSFGGCGILNREGEQADFPSVDRNGLSSIGFQPSFPLSFSISPVSGNCRDPQWYLLAVSVFATLVISIVATPPALFFSSIFVITFFQVALASDSPYALDYASVISLAFERFLPAAFVGVVLFRYCIRCSMKDFKAYWERSVLWVGGCWVGALNAYTFDHIPISRLTSHDLQQQPGAIVALIVILAVILAAAVGQIWALRIEGRLLRYIGFYIVLAVVIGCLVAIPGLDLRLHHYIIGLLLLPGTSLQTRPSLLYQGLLVGLFINGVARWGFASILQTPAVLLKGAQLGSALPTDLVPQTISDTISFAITQIADGFDGVSVLVNDVERFQVTNASLPVIFNWTRTLPEETAFFRFAFTGTYTLGGILYGDYTKPGTWFGNGTWKDMLPGPSR